MSTHDDPSVGPDGLGGRPDLEELPELDRTARAAATGLRSHVTAQLDAEVPLGFLTEHRPRRRGRILAAAAAVLLLVGAVAVLDQDEENQVEVDGDADAEELADLETSELTFLGPRDGKDSIRLPVVAEPQSGLVDGQEVTVTGSGFQPGEAVGLVQCAKEAGGDSPEVRAGIQGCYINQYTSLTADDAGVATGTYEVRRLLTTPLTGTIDCAAEAERCMLAMGALSDYDRSGAAPVVFDSAVEPIDLPTIEVSPTEGLGDGDVVHVVAEGLTPGEMLYAEVCSSDPQACWQAGGLDVQTESDSWLGSGGPVGLRVDADGRVEGDVTVWQYLPGPEPRTYVDCAVSRCALRLSGSTAPPTVPLAFLAGDGPIVPVFDVDPTSDLAVGDEVIIRGTGFRPGALVNVSLCASRGSADHEGIVACSYGASQGEERADAHGTYVRTFTIPELREEYEPMCVGVQDCDPPTPGPLISCNDGEVQCSIHLESWADDGAPPFTADPIPVTFR